MTRFHVRSDLLRICFNPGVLHLRQQSFCRVIAMVSEVCAPLG
jgi:hypothetical protein